MSEHTPPAELNNPVTAAAQPAPGGAPAPPRRQFVQGAAAATGALLGAPLFVPGSVLGLNGATPASSRIVMAGIGIGPRGTFVLNWMMREKDVRFVAVCDVQKS